MDSANAALAEVRIVAPDDTYQAAEMWATYYNPDLSRDPETHPSLPGRPAGKPSCESSLSARRSTNQAVPDSADTTRNLA
jgi:hypothetical protein